jgi:hypothetical protein
MPWFPDFANAVELVRRQTRAAGQADPVGQYLTAPRVSAGVPWSSCWLTPVMSSAATRLRSRLVTPKR